MKVCECVLGGQGKEGEVSSIIRLVIFSPWALARSLSAAVSHPLEKLKMERNY